MALGKEFESIGQSVGKGPPSNPKKNEQVRFKQAQMILKIRSQVKAYKDELQKQDKASRLDDGKSSKVSRPELEPQRVSTGDLFISESSPQKESGLMKREELEEIREERREDHFIGEELFSVEDPGEDIILSLAQDSREEVLVEQEAMAKVNAQLRRNELEIERLRALLKKNQLTSNRMTCIEGQDQKNKYTSLEQKTSLIQNNLKQLKRISLSLIEVQGVQGVFAQKGTPGARLNTSQIEELKKIWEIVNKIEELCSEEERIQKETIAEATEKAELRIRELEKSGEVKTELIAKMRREIQDKEEQKSVMSQKIRSLEQEVKLYQEKQKQLLKEVNEYSQIIQTQTAELSLWRRISNNPEELVKGLKARSHIETEQKKRIHQLETKFKNESFKKNVEEHSRLHKIVVSQQKQIEELMLETKKSDQTSLKSELEKERSKSAASQRQKEQMSKNLQSMGKHLDRVKLQYSQKERELQSEVRELGEMFSRISGRTETFREKCQENEKMVEIWRRRLEKLEDLEGLYQAKLVESEDKTIVIHQLQLKVFVLLSLLKEKAGEGVGYRRAKASIVPDRFGSDHTIQRFDFRGNWLKENNNLQIVPSQPSRVHFIGKKDSKIK